MSSLLKGGRLRATRKDVVEFISSFEADKRIAFSTVLVNEAHMIALARSGVIDRIATRKILRVLRELENHESSAEGLEDVHVLIEEYVTKRTGREVGGLLNLGKSRNDQVATAVRMTLRNEMLELSEMLLALELSILRLARIHTESVFPGYTHLQPAQPISFAHYLLTNGDSLLRDVQRLKDAYARVNCSPMGAAALAGTSFRLDRALIARLLGFEGLVEVSLDAVQSRDFALEALAVCALIASDISRMAQDFIFYSTAEVGLVISPDEFASTSSIMPQKKNPDPLELIRAKSAMIVSNFNSAAITMHGLPSGYNLDYQEITPLLWKSFDELKSCLRIFTGLIPKIRLDKRIAEKQYLQFTAATEIANLLVREEKLAFRTAHRVVGSVVRKALSQGKTLRQLQQADWEQALRKRISRRSMVSILRTLDLKRHLYVYRTKGSPNPQEMTRIIKQRWRRCERLLKSNSHLQDKLQRSMHNLHVMTKQPEG
jgi:argininosuccinate lyase